MEVWAQSDICDDQDDGSVPEWGCKSYTVCIGGDPVIIDCAAIGKVYNPDIKQCDE